MFSFPLVMTIATFVLVGIGLWTSQRGEGKTVAGSGNAYDAYYGGKKKTDEPEPPCEKCIQTGCIGAGECSCTCHQDRVVKLGLEA